MTDYSSVEYWDERYKNDEEPFEWFQKYDTIQPHLRKLLQKGDQILIVGSGNSQMSEKLYDDGFTSITNIDISNIVIHQMREKYKDRPGLTWIVHDITSSTTGKDILFNSTYDVIVDKGTFDSILCFKFGEKKVRKMVEEVYRVLKKKGMYILISCENEKERKGFLVENRYKWDLEVRKLLKPTFLDLPEEEKFHYMYILFKR